MSYFLKRRTTYQKSCAFCCSLTGYASRSSIQRLPFSSWIKGSSFSKKRPHGKSTANNFGVVQLRISCENTTNSMMNGMSDFHGTEHITDRLPYVFVNYEESKPGARLLPLGFPLMRRLSFVLLRQGTWGPFVHRLYHPNASKRHNVVILGNFFRIHENGGARARSSLFSKNFSVSRKVRT